MKRILSLLLLLICSNLNAQVFTEWVRTERDTPITGYSRLEDLVLDSSGNIYVSGTIDSLGDLVPVTMAFDTTGNLLWKKTIDGYNFNFSWRIKLTPNNEIISAGNYEDNTGTNNMIYSKRNQLGDTVHLAILNSPGLNTGDDFHDLVLDNTGNVYLAGQIKVGNNFVAGVCRFDTSGTLKWLSSYPLLTGWNSSIIRGMEMCGDSGLYLLTFNFSGYGSLLYCDTSGVFKWQKTLPISLNDYHTSLAIDSKGNAIAGGRLNQNAGLIKLNALGDTLWSKELSFPGLNGIISSIINIKTDSNGNIYALATSSGNPTYSIVAKLDSLGTVIWSDTTRGFSTLYGKNRDFFDVKDGIITLVTTKPTSWIYQFTDNGLKVRDEQLIIPGINNAEVNQIELYNGSIYITGNAYAGFNIRQGFVAKLNNVITSLYEPNKINQLQVFPNPASSYITISTPKNSLHEELNVTIFDLNGKEVRDFYYDNITKSINVSKLEAGVYFLSCKNENQLYTNRFVIQK